MLEMGAGDLECRGFVGDVEDFEVHAHVFGI